MDYQMPKLNGATACRNIGEISGRESFVSGIPDANPRDQTYEAGELDQMAAASYDASQLRARPARDIAGIGWAALCCQKMFTIHQRVPHGITESC
jgi:hypothetical protein